MKIVNRSTFLSLPAGTVFAKYKPYVFDDLQIKGENCGDNDYFYQGLVGSIDYASSQDFMETLEGAEREHRSVPMDFDTQGRDGCFDAKQLFAVFEPDDVTQLIARLHRALKGEEC
jgi:hypothetical protein